MVKLCIHKLCYVLWETNNLDVMKRIRWIFPNDDFDESRQAAKWSLLMDLKQVSRLWMLALILHWHQWKPTSALNMAINLKPCKIMYKFEVSGIKHVKPLVCPSSQVSFRLYIRSLCTWVNAQLARRRAFSVPTSSTKASCFSLRRLGAHQTMTAAFPLCFIPSSLAGIPSSVGVIDKQRHQQQLTVCPYSRASTATQLPKHAADGRWQRLVFCYCVWGYRENKKRKRGWDW